MKNSKVYDRPIKPFPEYVQKDITYKLHTLLLALLRPTITPSILQPNILNLSEEDWTRLFTLAAQHGVTALLFDTILRLPERLSMTFRELPETENIAAARLTLP